jgi:deoxyribonuclease V
VAPDRPPDRPAWPAGRAALERAQDALAAAAPPPWRPGPMPRVAGVFVCFERGLRGRGAAGDPAWAAAALDAPVGAAPVTAVVRGRAGAPYEPGLLALREGPLLEAAVRALPERPDVVLVDATGRDHPRRAGLALHLGAVLDLPTVGVTHRPLLAAGAWPIAQAGARSALILGHEEVGAWLRVRTTARPLAVHAAWRTDADTAAAVVLASTARGRVRTPRPLRAARHAARVARADDGG